MGYPIEIANSMPDPPELPVPGPWTRVILKVRAWFQRWFGRRRTHLYDQPGRYRQGVDLKRPPIQSEEASEFHADEVTDQLDSSGRVD